MTTSPSHDPSPTSSVTVWDDERLRLIHGDALAALRQIPDASIHAVVTDPPYAIEKGEVDVTDEELMRSSMLGMQSQNWHDKATHSRGYADHDPRQFQRWCDLWLTECLRVLKPGGHLVVFGGTRTWHRVAASAQDSGFEIRDNLAWLYASGVPKGLDAASAFRSIGDEAGAAQWRGWGTGLKPTFEPIILARKPLDGTVTENLSRHATGALNLGACRLHGPPGSRGRSKWAPNVHAVEHTAASIIATANAAADQVFFVSKPSSRERVAVDGVEHPTVKPLDLMRHLVRLVTPPGGLVLDPFAGSGTTIEACIAEGLRAIGIEREAQYLPLIQERIRRRLAPFSAEPDDSLLTLPL